MDHTQSVEILHICTILDKIEMCDMLLTDMIILFRVKDKFFYEISLYVNSMKNTDATNLLDF